MTETIEESLLQGKPGTYARWEQDLRERYSHLEHGLYSLAERVPCPFCAAPVGQHCMVRGRYVRGEYRPGTDVALTHDARMHGLVCYLTMLHAAERAISGLYEGVPE